MRLLLTSLAAALLLSVPAAMAQDLDAASVPGDQSFSGVDTDRNGLVSWAEFSLVFTDINEEQFRVADVDGDGQLSQAEFDTLVLSVGTIDTRPRILPVEPEVPRSLVDDSTGDD